VSASHSANRSASALARLDRSSLRALIEPVVGATGCDLEDVTDQRAGSRRLLRVVVDRDGGVSEDDITAVSHAVSTALDDVDVFGDAPYVLEITSPGVDRPLTEPRHWRRAAGRLVKATLTDAGPAEALRGEVLGRVLESDDEGVTLTLQDGDERVRIPYARVAKARMQVEFNRPGADGPDETDGDDDGADES
jgi:ribosome maturation factor RimP